MRIQSARIIAITAALVLAGCANNQQITESSVAETPPSSSSPATDDPTPQANTTQQTPDQTNTLETVATRVIARNQDLMYANSAQVQELIALDTTNRGNRALNEIVREQLAPLRAALAQAPPATTWYAVRPLSIAIEEQTDTTAKVSVWSIEVFSREAFLDPEAWWWITDLELINENGTWLVDNYTQRPGPVAAPGTDHWPTSAIDLNTQLERHTLIFNDTTQP